MIAKSATNATMTAHLGLTHPIGADVAACLIHDGKLKGIYEEERFTRQKHALNAIPTRSIEALLRDAGLSIKDLSSISVGFTEPSTAWNAQLGSRLRRFLGDMRLAYRFHDSRLNWLGVKQHRIDHYEAHALSVLPYLRSSAGNILVLDGWGGDSAGAAFVADSCGQLKELWRIPVNHSIGLFYQLVTARLGFSPHSDEGKTMGLAAFGKPDSSVLPDLCDQQSALPDVSAYFEYLQDNFPQRASADPIQPNHIALAATAQWYLERAVLRCAERVHEQTGLSTFALAGGVALNCVANGKLLEQPFVDQLYVHPASSDSGVSIGAAFSASQESGERVGLGCLADTPFWGPNYSDGDVDAAISFANLRLTKGDVVGRIASALASGAVVGIFDGRAEVGPRALGARSILADPRTVQSRDRVNSLVKRRESWRPFAPSILTRFTSTICKHATTTMTVSSDVFAEWQEAVPAVVHVDGTARAHAVPDGSFLSEILENFLGLTGVPVLLNTSFNLNDEPMVLKPDQALATFYRSGLDILAFRSGYLVKDDKWR